MGGPIQGMVEWWRAQAAAGELHRELQHAPGVWRLPCDTSKPDDVIVARAVQILLQRHPGRYRVIWGAKNLSIYHTGAFVASVPDRDAATLARWGLLVPPRPDSAGIHAPPPSVGGRAFNGERTDPEPAGGTTPEVEVKVG